MRRKIQTLIVKYLESSSQDITSRAVSAQEALREIFRLDVHEATIVYVLQHIMKILDPPPPPPPEIGYHTIKK